MKPNAAKRTSSMRSSITKPENRMKHIDLMQQHFRRMAATGTDVYGPRATPMWMSVLDTRTGLPPSEPHTPKRVYRLIGAPQGATLYWDQPMVVAAHELSRMTGRPEYAQFAERYLGSFLENSIAENGIFRWGNHAYYDAMTDEIVEFHKGYHELRPITPAWDLFWQRDGRLCERYIRTMLARHVYDPITGGFNRHDDGKKGDAFIEAGGILVETAAWLHAKTNDPELLETALKIAGYSYRHRDEKTGLIINQPDYLRWDSEVCTTEIGVWAQSLLRAVDYTANEAFSDMAHAAVSAYLKYGYDEAERRYYGQLRVSDGTPQTPSEKGYWPGRYADAWSAEQWPTHDYPMALAEACVNLYRRSKEEVFVEAIHRLAELVFQKPPAQRREGGYAENYGRCIHFLAHAGRVLADDRLLDQAHALAEEAIDTLRDGDLFQGLPETHLYESVDGVGFLFLALMLLEDAQEQDLHGFGF